MKRLLVVIVVLAGVLFGANRFYLSQAEKKLSQAASAARAMGGSLAYSDLAITLDGKVQIEDVRFTPPGSDQAFKARRVVLHTDGFLGVHKLAMDLRENRMPERLGLSIEGVLVPVSWQGVQSSDLLPLEGADDVPLLACGNWMQFSEAELTEMGFPELVATDTHLEYRLSGDASLLEVDVRSAAHEMHVFDFNMAIALNAGSLDMAAISKAMIKAQLMEVSVDYSDRGYAAQVLDFCQKRSGLDRKEFLTQHLVGWQNDLTAIGFVAGDNLIKAYEQFIDQPSQFGITAKPIGGLAMKELVTVAPNLLPYQFQTELTVNGTAMGPLDLTVTESFGRLAKQVPTQPTGRQAKAVRAAEQTKSRQPSAPRVITVAELHNHLNAEVSLSLTSGQLLQGRVRRFDETVLQLHSYYSGGSMTIPVAYASIAEVKLK